MRPLSKLAVLLNFRTFWSLFVVYEIYSNSEHVIMSIISMQFILISIVLSHVPVPCNLFAFYRFDRFHAAHLHFIILIAPVQFVLILVAVFSTE